MALCPMRGRRGYLHMAFNLLCTFPRGYARPTRAGQNEPRFFPAIVAAIIVGAAQERLTMVKRSVLILCLVVTGFFTNPAIIPASAAAENEPAVLSLPEPDRIITLSSDMFLAGKAVFMEIPMRSDGTDTIFFSIGRDSPNGTRILAVYGDRGETLGAMLPSMPGLDEYGEMEEGAAIALGAYDLDGDGVSEVIIASNDGAAMLSAAIFRYEDKEHERFHLLGILEGQQQLVIESDGAIIAPFGSQGLFSEYRLAPDGTITEKE